MIYIIGCILMNIYVLSELRKYRGWAVFL